MLGLSGDSKIFYVDMRENQTKINYYHINEYQKEKSDEEFQSLSRNKNNSFVFAVGTSYKAMIFDIRQMKEPCCTFAPDLDGLKPRQINVSWSPSGKYIFTHAPLSIAMTFFEKMVIVFHSFGTFKMTNELECL